MTNSKHIAERLARYYAEALAKNPKSTIGENMEIAVNSVPLVNSAPELLEALEAAEKAFGNDCEDGGFCPVTVQMRAAIKKARGIK